MISTVVRKIVDPKSIARLERIAHQMEATLRSAFIAAIKSAKDQMTISTLEDALNSGRPAEAVLRAMGGLEFEEMRRTLAELVEASGYATTEGLRRVLPKSASIKLARFDLTNPFAIDYARRETANMVREITDTTREGIQAIINRGTLGELTVNKQAQEIRKFIGLTEYQTNVVFNYQTRLLSEGASNVEEKTARYYEKMLRYRSMNIARTESMDAAVAGQQGAWASAQEQGVLPEDVEQVWIVTEDERLCEICAPIPDMPENQHVKVGGIFIDGEGKRVTRPPQTHPSCRCDVALNVP